VPSALSVVGIDNIEMSAHIFPSLTSVHLPVARIGALLPFVMMIVILLFRPRGLLGTRDT